MLNIFNTGDDSRFSWDSMGNIAEGRKNLGEDMPVLMYRLFQYTLRSELTQRLGEETVREILRSAGALAGREFAAHLLDLTLPLNEFLASLQNILEEQKIGILRIEKFNAQTGEAVLTIGEDLDCSGLPVTGNTVCNYDEGFLAGVFSEYTGKEYVVTEIDCWGSGARVCRFQANISH
ncbi:MAG: 4-vinyl reductase [Lacrimispora sp.]